MKICFEVFLICPIVGLLCNNWISTTQLRLTLNAAFLNLKQNLGLAKGYFIQ